MHELSIVIPVFNEDRNIVATIEAIEQHAPVDHEIICVYDFDEDTTLPVLRGLQANRPHLRLARNTVARGPSGALRTGFQEADAPRVLVVMADLCDDVSQIPELVRLVPEHADVACPSRYCPEGRQELDAFLKVALPRTAGFLLRHFTGMQTHDPTNSFKMYSARLLQSLRLTSTVSFSVTLEVVAKAHCLGFPIAQVPTVWRDRQHGESKFRTGPSVPVYLKWFLVALLKNRVFSMPASWMQARFGRPATEPSP